MKKTIQVNLILLWATALLAMSGCTKEGPPGPAGSSNVTSTTFVVNSWGFSTPNHYSNLSVPELTSSNINTAAVMAYFNVGGSTWYALPYTQYNSPSNYYMGFNTKAGQVQITWFYDSSLSDGDDPNEYYGATVHCKVVVIPPAERKANPDLDLNNYEEVRNRFNLKD